jgi:CRP-like cAMP-binding protein
LPLTSAKRSSLGMRRNYACSIRSEEAMRPDPEQIADVPLFESLSGEQLSAIASLSELRHEPAGTVLVREGVHGYALFVLQEGTAVVTSGEDKIRTLRPGDFFGEIALLREGLRTATVTATTPVTLLVMHGSDFRVFERDWPEASELMRTTMRERLAEGS